MILPVPWEVTVSFGSGTARCAEQIMRASLQVDLFDPDIPEGWKQGFFMRESDQKILLKSDYLRKEAELYIDYISKGDIVDNNQFMRKTLKEVNEGSYFLNNWVYQQTKAPAGQRQTRGPAGRRPQHATGFHESHWRKIWRLWHHPDRCPLRPAGSL